MRYCYSNNCETFEFGTYSEAALAIWEDGEHEVGDVISLWEAEKMSVSIKKFVPDMASELLDRAADEYGDYSYNWDFSEEDRKSLQSVVEAAVEKWAKETGNNPTFYEVGRPTEIRVRFINEEGDSLQLDPKTGEILK